MGHFFGELFMLVLSWGLVFLLCRVVYKFFCNPVQSTFEAVEELTDTANWNYGTQEKPWYR
jgi:hypothetical protein